MAFKMITLQIKFIFFLNYKNKYPYQTIYRHFFKHIKNLNMINTALNFLAFNASKVMKGAPCKNFVFIVLVKIILLNFLFLWRKRWKYRWMRFIKDKNKIYNYGSNVCEQHWFISRELPTSRGFLISFLRIFHFL